VANRVTVVSEDGQWKAEMHAWKSHWIVYASIGSECSVYHRQETKNVWGQSVIDWVKVPATITITNIYRGSGLEITRVGQFNSADAELKEFATGFFLIKINLDTGGVDPGVGGPSMIVETVEAHIAASTGRQILSGVVTAGTYVVDQSTW
jgi:hypothetical protein